MRIEGPRPGLPCLAEHSNGACRAIEETRPGGSSFQDFEYKPSFQDFEYHLFLLLIPLSFYLSLCFSLIFPPPLYQHQTPLYAACHRGHVGIVTLTNGPTLTTGHSQLTAPPLKHHQNPHPTSSAVCCLLQGLWNFQWALDFFNPEGITINKLKFKGATRGLPHCLSEKER